MMKLDIPIAIFKVFFLVSFLYGCSPPAEKVSPEQAAANKRYQSCLHSMFMKDATFAQAGAACDGPKP